MSNDIYSYIESNFGIKITDYQFKRDYIKEPLKRGEKPYKEDLEYLYITLNLSTLDIKKLFKISQGKLERILKNFSIKKLKNLVSEVYKRNCLEKYGIDNLSKTNNIKDKMKETNIKKYGTEWVVQSDYFKERYKQVCLERYGVDNANKSIEIKNKSKQTKLEKYGDENYSNKEKYKQTCLERYGVEYYNQKNIPNEIIKLINDEKLLKMYIENNNIINCVHLSKLLNISEGTVCQRVKKYDLKKLLRKLSSYNELKIIEYINQYYITENNTRKYLDGKEIDIYIPELKIGIEFNGDYWHCESKKIKKYHQQKSLLAESKGIFIYHIFEHEWINKKDKIINQLNNLLGINKEKIYARKCIIKEVDNKEKKLFLEENHLQGNDQSSIKLGLYYEDKLVSIMTFVKPRFNKKYEWELSRFCSKANTNVIGGASKLFKYFVEKYNPQSIISYSNIAHTKGKLYETLGFTFDSISEPNYVWCNHGNVLSRYQCQKHKLLEQEFKGNSETEIMHNRGYYRIYDCGNKVWVWNNNT